MNGKILIAAFGFLFVLTLFHNPTLAQTQKTELIQGTVFISQMAISKVNIIFSSSDSKYEVTTNDDGFYEIYLPPNIYQVTSNAVGFCPIQRASFYVKPLSKQTLNLNLYVCGLESGFTVDSNGKFVSEFCRLVPPYKTESFSLSKSSNPSLNLHIMFNGRKQNENIIEYGKSADSDLLGVNVTYNLLTLSADKASFNKKTLKLKAEGNVLVEDGKQQYRFSNAEIDFNAKDPIASITGK